MGMISITSHQKDIALNVLDCLVNNRESCILNGSAGTGKTFTANYIINELFKCGVKSIFVSAPTHPAVEVLKGKVEKERNVLGSLKFGTLHSYLKLQKKIVGDKELFLSSNIPIDHSQILIIDESSMVGTSLLDIIKNNINYPILYIGDEKQINPIDEAVSPIFNSDLPIFTLEEILRQESGSDIINLSKELKLLKEDTDGKDFTFHDNVDELLESMYEGALYLCWRRNKAYDTNQLARNYIHDKNSNGKMLEVPQFVVGETIIFTRPYKGGYKNNQRVKIQRLQITTKTMRGVSLKLWVINHKINVVHVESEGEYNKILKSFKTANNWIDFYKFMDEVAHVKYSHASTIHSAQGQTFENVIIDYNDITLNSNIKEMKRILYTAITRASRHVHILKTKT